jgi:TonB family protein
MARVSKKSGCAQAAVTGIALILSACAGEPMHRVRSTPVQFDPAHPARVEWQLYPEESKRRGEQGTCKVSLTVGTDGSVRAAELRASTGFSRLDQACLLAYRGARFLPATENGKKIVSTIDLPITWKLEGQ